MAFLLSACEAPNKQLLVPLSDFNREVQIHKNEHLEIHVSKKLPSLAEMGGETMWSQVGFQEITPWLERRLNALHNPGCRLDKNIILTVSVVKLYNNIDNRNTVVVLALNGKFNIHGKQVASLNYRAESVENFFAESGPSAIQGCFNSAIDKILPVMKSDLCRLSKS